jgi:hypothetical protein
MIGRLRRRLQGERGAVAVFVGLSMVVLCGSVAVATDLARLRHERHVLQAAVDLGALAGAQSLPVVGSTQAAFAVSTARAVAVANAPSLQTSGLTIDFRCIVGDPEGNGGADSPDFKIACGPAGSGTWTTGWTTYHGKATHSCDPNAGDLCNTIVLQASSTVVFDFAKVIGFNSGSTGTVMGASCRGICGMPTAPLDVMLVFDRSYSMTDADIANAKNAALAVLSFYNSSLQYVGLVGLPYHNPSNKCVANSTQNYPMPGNAWLLVGLSSDYSKADGTLNANSTLVKTIQCLQRTPATTRVTPCCSGHTDLGDPLQTAADTLISTGRAKVPKVIILISDGEANQPLGSQPCSYAVQKAAAAKAQNIDIFSVAFGAAGAKCSYDTSGTYRNAYATSMFAAMATSSVDHSPGGCGAMENKDGDNYFCEPKSSDLEPVLRRVAAQAVQQSRLVDI